MEKANNYLVKWIQFELDKESILDMEPEEKAIETAYDRLTELDKLVLNLNDDEIEYAKSYGNQIIKSIKDKEELSRIMKDLT